MRYLIDMFEWSVLSMAVIRFIGGSIEMVIAIFMLYFNDPKTSLALNSMISISGSTILILTMSIGVVGVAQDLPLSKFLFVAIGVSFILYGVFK